VLSFTSVLSLLTFLTTVLALVRVGSAAFLSNQNQLQFQLAERCGGAPTAQMILAHGVGLGTGAVDGGVYKGFVGGHELVRMPVSWAALRRPSLLFRPPSPGYDSQRPLSMAKLIMSRHTHRRPSRAPSIQRRPPGLSSNVGSRSRLIQEVA